MMKPKLYFKDFADEHDYAYLNKENESEKLNAILKGIDSLTGAEVEDINGNYLLYLNKQEVKKIILKHCIKEEVRK